MLRLIPARYLPHLHTVLYLLTYKTLSLLSVCLPAKPILRACPSRMSFACVREYHFLCLFSSHIRCFGSFALANKQVIHSLSKVRSELWRPTKTMREVRTGVQPMTDISNIRLFEVLNIQSLFLHRFTSSFTRSTRISRICRLPTILDFFPRTRFALIISSGLR